MSVIQLVSFASISLQISIYIHHFTNSPFNIIRFSLMHMYIDYFTVVRKPMEETF